MVALLVLIRNGKVLKELCTLFEQAGQLFFTASVQSRAALYFWHYSLLISIDFQHFLVFILSWMCTFIQGMPALLQALLQCSLLYYLFVCTKVVFPTVLRAIACIILIVCFHCPLSIGELFGHSDCATCSRWLCSEWYALWSQSKNLISFSVSSWKAMHEPCKINCMREQVFSWVTFLIILWHHYKLSECLYLPISPFS